ncbi:MAG TPA: AAA family ATPase [Candidatus Saccharimonadales bacterium]
MNSQDLILDMLKSGGNTARQIAYANTFTSGYTRRAYLIMDQQARAAFQPGSLKSWTAMPGLRGIGKSTILAQLYSHPSFKESTKVFVSFDRIKTVNGTAADFIASAEKFIGSKFEDHDKPIAIFVDEVQYLENWAVALKTIYDRCSKVFIFCTGSSALSLQTNADVARRIDIVKLHPLCLTEYVMIKQASKGLELSKPVPGVAGAVREALFNSSSAVECYNRLRSLIPQVEAYWRSTGFSKNDLFTEFLKYGTLPFTLTLPNETSVWDRINRTLHESLDRDVTAMGKFERETVSKLPQLLFALASSVEVSINKLARDVGPNERTVTSVLQALEKTEIITAIPPKGAHNGTVKKASKYLFTSPAMRAALLNFGGIITPENSSSLKGKLVEDLIGMYLKRLFIDANISRAIVEYDTAKGGADFIVSKDGTRANSIVIEVGANKTTTRQAKQTMTDIGARYGLVITGGKLGIEPKSNVAIVPFEFMLLA